MGEVLDTVLVYFALQLRKSTSKVPDRRCQKSFFGHKKTEQRILELWQSKIIDPQPFDQFEQNLEIKKVSETKGEWERRRKKRGRRKRSEGRNKGKIEKE